jgi:hypothetical protein
VRGVLTSEYMLLMQHSEMGSNVTNEKGGAKMEGRTNGSGSRSSSDSGQITIIVAIALSTFLIGFVGFGVDMTNLWFHRQAAQGAADAACLAGAMDMLIDQECPTCSPYGGFIPGPATGFDCASVTPLSPATGVAPCQYASTNGYSSPGLTAGTVSNDVQVTFPSSVPGATTPTVAQAGNYPFMRVDVADRVRVYIASILTRSPTQDVRATAKCGLVYEASPIPILVLNPTCQHPFEISGSGYVSILGGPSRSIQVNSSNQTCAAATTNSTSNCTSTSNLAIDLSQGGPNFTGSDIGVFGSPHCATCSPASPPSPGVFNPGTTGSWVSPAGIIPDPYKNLPAPSTTGLPVDPPQVHVGYGVDGCPDQGDLSKPSVAPPGCTEYTQGVYNSAIDIAAGTTAIFAPGIYYIKGSVNGNKGLPGAGCVTPPSGQGHYGLTMGSNVVVRPTNTAGDGSGGTLFYFSKTASGNYGSVISNSSSGQYNDPSGGGSRTIDPFPGASVTCPGGPAPDVPPSGGIPANLTGNVLLGPCTGPYNGACIDSTCSSAGDGYRGMLFFDDRSNGDPNGQPSLQGGGGLLLAGTLYFHNCPNSPTCTAADYKAFFDLQGASGSTTYTYGNIITDELVMGGGGHITMQLNSHLFIYALKVALMQ